MKGEVLWRKENDPCVHCTRLLNLLPSHSKKQTQVAKIESFMKDVRNEGRGFGQIRTNVISGRAKGPCGRPLWTTPIDP